MNRLTKCPCQHCEQRTITCHSYCKDYKSYRKKVKETTRMERNKRAEFGQYEYAKGQH